MKILVTGSTGFLGRHLVHHLLADGHDLRCLVRSMARGLEIRQRGLELVEGDLTDLAAVLRAAHGVDAVVHAAGQLGGWGPESLFLRNNLQSTENLAEACSQNDIRAIVAISSVAVYGRQPDHPLAEEAEILAEDDAYCRTKLSGEHVLRTLAETLPASVTVVRPSIIYGAYDTHFSAPVVRQLRRRWAVVVGDPEHGLPLVYAGDVARMVRLRLRNPEPGFHVFNLSSPEKVTWTDVASVVAETGRSPRLVHLPYAIAFVIGAVLESFGRISHASKAPMLTRFVAVLLGLQYNFISTKALSVPGFGGFTPFKIAFRESLEWISSNSPLGPSQDKALPDSVPRGAVL